MRRQPPRLTSAEPEGPWVQTVTGRAVPLARPEPADIDLRGDVAHALAALARFNGHTQEGPYSVAQHCCLIADAAFAETGRADIAAYGLLHDAHEAYLGDIVTPIQWELARRVGRVVDKLQDTGRACFEMALTTLKMEFDAAIHARAGLVWPPDKDTRQRITDLDLRALAAERNDLMPPAPFPWRGLARVEPLRRKGRIRPWPFEQARAEYIARLQRFLPESGLGAGHPLPVLPAPAALTVPETLETVGLHSIPLRSR